MLQELGKQNPNLMRLIQDHQADFLGLINEPVEGGEGYELSFLLLLLSQAGSELTLLLSIHFPSFFLIISLYTSLFFFLPISYLPLSCTLNPLMFIRNMLGQLGGAAPQALAVTPEERDAIERVSFFNGLGFFTGEIILFFTHYIYS